MIRFYRGRSMEPTFRQGDILHIDQSANVHDLRPGDIIVVWKPKIRRVRFCSPEGEYVKYIHRGRTVAVWWPARNECRFRKPFDLVLWREVDRERDRAAAEARGPES